MDNDEVTAVVIVEGLVAYVALQNGGSTVYRPT